MVNIRGREHDLGKGFILSEYLDEDGTLIGYFVTGPAASQCKSSYEGRCGGLVGIRPHEEGGKTYSVWEVEGEWPNITLKPSVMCNCGGQHSFVVNGVWQ